MRSLKVAPLALIAFAIALLGVREWTLQSEAPEAPAPYLVLLNTEIEHAPATIGYLARQEGFNPKKAFRIIPAFTADLTRGQVRALENHPWVKKIEPDAQVELHAQTIPWGIARVGAPESSQRAGDGQGEVTGVNVYILDTADGFEQNDDLNGEASGFDGAGKISLQGRFTDAETGSALGGVGIVYYTSGEWSDGWSYVGVDANGNYIVNGLQPGEYKLHASLNQDYYWQETTVTIVAEEATRKDFALQPIKQESIFQGRVTDSTTGAGVSGASINVFLSRFIWTTVQADASGFYSKSYKFGTRTLNTRASGAGYFSTGIIPVSFVEGGVSTQDYSLGQLSAPPPPPPGTLRGTVFDQSGNAVAGATVQVSNGPGAQSDIQGAYSFSLAAGSYTLTASKSGYASQVRSASVSSGQTTTLDFSIQFCPLGELGNSGKCKGKPKGRGNSFQFEPASDCFGHGTHVAGTAGAIDNDRLVVGVAPGVKVVAVRVFPECIGSTSFSTIIEGLDWVVQNGQKPGVINMSLGGGVNEVFDAAVRATRDAGFVVVVSAGNSSSDACFASPANEGAGVDNGIITVAATDAGNNEASFSNYGQCVDLWAPGVFVESTCKDGGTCTFSGTSMSSPHAAGAAALYLSTHPSATPAEVEAALRSASVLTGTLSKDGRQIRLLNVSGF